MGPAEDPARRAQARLLGSVLELRGIEAASRVSLFQPVLLGECICQLRSPLLFGALH